MRVSANFYEELRKTMLPKNILSDTGRSNELLEKWLYAIWSHQRIRGNSLRTLTGKSIRIIHPGFLSNSEGPDFRDALISIENQPTQQCDIEIDISPDDWYRHGHDRNPLFQQVGLQIVWNIPHKYQNNTDRSILKLNDFLDSPLEELLEWSLSDNAAAVAENVIGKCSQFFVHFNQVELNSLLSQASVIRLKCKAHLITATAQEYGWERALLIHLIRGLGYKQNTWPMQRLAETVAPISIPLLNMQALLLGTAGLIPKKLTLPPEKESYLVRLWQFWWRQISEMGPTLLPSKIWKLSGNRPNNHPQRRIALAAHWLINPKLISSLIEWSSQDIPIAESLKLLLKILSPQNQDPFWEKHYTLKSKPTVKALPLLGTDRTTDLFINVIAPWLYARTKGNASSQKLILKRILNWPGSSKNIKTTHALTRFYGNTPHPKLNLAYQQQGLLQIISDFCSKSDSCCGNCSFPCALELQQKS